MTFSSRVAGWPSQRRRSLRQGPQSGMFLAGTRALLLRVKSGVRIQANAPDLWPTRGTCSQGRDSFGVRVGGWAAPPELPAFSQD